MKKDERLAEYIDIKDKYFESINDTGLSKEEKLIIKSLLKNMMNIKIYIILEIIKI